MWWSFGLMYRLGGRNHGGERNFKRRGRRDAEAKMVCGHGIMECVRFIAALVGGGAALADPGAASPVYYPAVWNRRRRILPDSVSSVFSCSKNQKSRPQAGTGK